MVGWLLSGSDGDGSVGWSTSQLEGQIVGSAQLIGLLPPARSRQLRLTQPALFERFTHEARSAVTAAVAEAERRDDRHIETDHLLVGLCPTAPAVIGPMGIAVEDLRAAWDEMERLSGSSGMPACLPTQPEPR